MRLSWGKGFCEIFMIPTQRLYWLLLLGLAIAPLLTLIFTRSLTLLLLVLYDLILFGIGIWENQQTKQNRAKIKRLPLHKLSIGRDNPVYLTLKAPNQKINLQIQGHLPSGLTVADFPLTSHSAGKRDGLWYF